MKTVALISGGKDSTYNMMQCIAAGHDIIALANLVPSLRTEIDSYMYQSVGYEAIELISQAMNLPLYRKETLGKSTQQEKVYYPTENDEVEDLYLLLKEVMEKEDVSAVSVGAILSDYQRVRVENVCIRLGLTPLAYLWQRDQKELLDEMINCEVDAIVIKVASLGLEPSKHLGRTLSSLQSHLFSMNEKYGLNVCGEGGEYETLTLDCPLFNQRIIIEESEVVIHSNNSIAPVGYLKFNKLKLGNKIPMLGLNKRLEGLPLKDSDGYVTDQGEDALEESQIVSDSGDATNDIPNTPPHLTTLADQETIAAKSLGGWLWIGGIRGNSSDSSVAMSEAMRKLKCILGQYHHSFDNVVCVSAHIGDMKEYLKLNKIYCEVFVHPNPPTRACVEVPLDENCPVIVEALSWLPPEDNLSDPPITRSTIHVQSRSHWAPANIGPYSQAIKIGEVILLAGQIGLVPGSLELVKGGIKPQCRLVLRHISRLLKAVDPNVNLRDVVQGICYVIDIGHIDNARKLWEESTNNAIVDYVVVKTLPKNALVEWHVWAHRYNNQFEYEETGKCIDNNWSISIFRRWNYENNVAAIVCHLDNNNDDDDISFNPNLFKECIDYLFQKIQQGHENDSGSLINLKIFYPVSKRLNPNSDFEYLNQFRMDNKNLVYTIVPVCYLKTRHTYLSISGIRNQ